MKQTGEVLGVDVGQVLIEQYAGDPDLSFFGPRYLDAPEMPDAFRVLGRLRHERFGDNIWLITRCGRKLRERRLQWLRHHYFFEHTGILKAQLRYCWSPHNKSNVCHDLGMQFFIDDDPRELIHLEDLIPKLILFRPKVEQAVKHARFIANSATRADSWLEIEKLLLP